MLVDFPLSKRVYIIVCILSLVLALARSDAPAADTARSGGSGGGRARTGGYGESSRRESTRDEEALHADEAFNALLHRNRIPHMHIRSPAELREWYRQLRLRRLNPPPVAIVTSAAKPAAVVVLPSRATAEGFTSISGTAASPTERFLVGQGHGRFHSPDDVSSENNMTRLRAKWLARRRQQRRPTRPSEP